MNPTTATSTSPAAPAKSRVAFVLVARASV